MTNKNNLKGSLILMITAMVWGASFVSQSVGASILGPNSFNGIRILLGAVALLPLAKTGVKIAARFGAFDK